MALFPRSISRTLVGLAFSLCVAQPFGAAAQTSPVEPYYAVTTRADVPLKSGDMDGYYPVALLPKDQVLWVDAEGAGWARVSYPPGLTVFVAAADVREEVPGTLVLTKVSALKSRNASAGFAQSWQRAIPRGSELAIGSRLKAVEPLNGPDGKPVAFIIDPPKEVRAFVKADSLRQATQAEVEAYLAANPPVQPVAEEPKPTEPQAAKPEPVEPEPAKPAEAKPVPAKPAEATPAEAKPGEAQPAKPKTDESLLQPMQPEGEQPAGAGPGVTEINQGAATPQEREIGTLEHLASAFAEVQSQPSDTAELDELAAEIRRAMAAEGDDAAGRRVRAALQDRLKLVEMRIELRDRSRELRARREAIDASAQAVTGRVRELERSRGYQFVGRLVRSSVYDGVRLPLMYRMVSVNESVPRTIGYIRPGADGLDIAGKLGEIVGVLGTSDLDRALQLRVVTPTRVDVLQAEGLAFPTPAAPGG